MLILSLNENEKDVFNRVLDVIKQSNLCEIEKVETKNVIQNGELLIDFTQHIVYKGKQEICVTNTEFQILYFLALHKGMVVSKDQIYEYVWNGEYAIDDSNITAHIRRLRVKIEDDPAKPKYIQTVRGVGYRFWNEK